MKKTVLFIIAILLLTGCSAKYDIYIDSNTITDTIEIYEDINIVKNATDKQTKEFDELLLDWERGYDFYKRELYATDKVTGYRYTYDFTYNEYSAMSQLRKCYDKLELTNDNIITLKTSNDFLCGDYYPNTEQIEIKISSKYEIIESNADSKSNNIHTWIINKKNYKNKPIILKIDKGSDYKNAEIKNKFTITQLFITIVFIVLVITLIIRKKRNK